MTTPNTLFASVRRTKAYGLLVAGGMLFAIGVGGSGALVAAYTGATASNTVALHSAA